MAFDEYYYFFLVLILYCWMVNIKIVYFLNENNLLIMLFWYF